LDVEHMDIERFGTVSPLRRLLVHHWQRLPHTLRGGALFDKCPNRRLVIDDKRPNRLLASRIIDVFRVMHEQCPTGVRATPV
jgi:hypothetical protein